MYWLFKEDPSHYSFDDLIKDGKTKWTGVHNNLAIKHLRNVKNNDLIFFYHTENEKKIVGIMKASSDAYSTDKEPLEKSKEVGVNVVPLNKLDNPVTLQSIKGDAMFANFPLVRISRLSVMPVSEKEWKRIEQLSSPK